eukprot:CAMPEP_0170208226 /NCGR_PEP_ID=MMETSP0116_2-20130129/3696_1 /TAXON_ID=400756 /ORGANISM="Durinskia baltica, Strain CSIRO CS-38" /LENGTH=306 /DNA_ID=CAMNT_0010458695 /DNA_START=20 /DNA_END=940 /DNA_ORIENTATION=-
MHSNQACALGVFGGAGAFFVLSLAGCSICACTSMMQLSQAFAKSVQTNQAVRETRTPCGFREFFDKHTSGPGIHKWPTYFPVYEEHFGRYCDPALNHSVRMLEWGIQSGGSMMMWRAAFGPHLETLVGCDINPKTKNWEAFGPNVHVRVGSQADPAHLKAIMDEFHEGFDIILDDASHIPWHIFVTFATMWKAIRPGGVYLIEDLHGRNPVFDWILRGHTDKLNLTWAGVVYPGAGDIGTDQAIPRESKDTLNYFPNGRLDAKPSEMQHTIESVKIYPYMIAITKRAAPLKEFKAIRRGTQWIPYK